MNPFDYSRRDFLASASAVALVGLRPGPGRAEEPSITFKPIVPPPWVQNVTRMAFVTPGQVEKAVQAGAQVIHGNAAWPYYPLRRAGGRLRAEEEKILRQFVADCHRNRVKFVLGLPPFPPVALVQVHPDWRVHPDLSGAILKVAPVENQLGTRLGCNLGPWGDYLIEICAELVQHEGVDGFSFDGNYHPPICYCGACRQAYRQARGRDLPAKADLDEIAYRQYLGWRGERLEGHYRRLQARIKAINPDAVLMSWTVNAGRYGHLLTSPRSMPTRLNLLFDLPMQEWWLDETNLGASVAPAFGAAYLRALSPGRPCASEAYLMSRGNPYGTDSFPVHERSTRNLLALSQGNITAESFGWPGHEASTEAVLRQVREREAGLSHVEPFPWAGLLVSEQTRQFHAYRDIAERFLPHVFGAFRCGMEEHLPVQLLNDWDLTAERLRSLSVIVLPNAAALSDGQVAALREYVRAGGGLMATGETSLCDEWGRPRGEFALAEVLGVSYQAWPGEPGLRPGRDANAGQQRSSVATLQWADHPLFDDPRLAALVPGCSVTFRGPMVRVSPSAGVAPAATMTLLGQPSVKLPAIVAHSFGQGRVVYFAAAVDAALWSYAYPYQRRLLARALAWAARQPAPIRVAAPLCVQATFFTQESSPRRRLIIHLFNGLNTAANHGLPASDVPLREETVPIDNIAISFSGKAPRLFFLEPGHRPLAADRQPGQTVIRVPRLEVHAMVVGEW